MKIMPQICEFDKMLKTQEDEEDATPNGLLPPKDTEVKRPKRSQNLYLKSQDLNLKSKTYYGTSVIIWCNLLKGVAPDGKMSKN